MIVRKSDLFDYNFPPHPWTSRVALECDVALQSDRKNMEAHCPQPSRSLSKALRSAINRIVQAVPRSARTRLYYTAMDQSPMLRVLSGPFTGLQYLENSTGSLYYPKILGTYEKELHKLVDRFKNVHRIVDVGAAEGYYAVGLAWLLQGVKVKAFEATASGQQMIRALASINGVADRVDVGGFCDISALSSALGDGDRALVIVDVEGAEADILDPSLCPGLANATILVEVHDSLRPGTGLLLRERLGETHDVEVIWEEARTMADFPLALSFLRRAIFTPMFLRSMNERRGPRMHWLYCVPKRPSITRAEVTSRQENGPIANE